MQPNTNRSFLQNKKRIIVLLIIFAIVLIMAIWFLCWLFSGIFAFIGHYFSLNGMGKIFIIILTIWLIIKIWKYFANKNPSGTATNSTSTSSTVSPQSAKLKNIGILKPIFICILAALALFIIYWIAIRPSDVGPPVKRFVTVPDSIRTAAILPFDQPLHTIAGKPYIFLVDYNNPENQCFADKMYDDGKKVEILLCGDADLPPIPEKHQKWRVVKFAHSEWIVVSRNRKN